MSLGLIGKKQGMTRIFTEEGKSLPVTVINIEPNTVTQLKTNSTRQSDDPCNEPFAESLKLELILKHAWLNLWDKHMTTDWSDKATISTVIVARYRKT